MTAIYSMYLPFIPQPYEIPSYIIIEKSPFTIANGLLTSIGKKSRRALAVRYRQQILDLAKGARSL
jgi:hypothetical protein